MNVACPKCKAPLAEVMCLTAFTASYHCGLCGHDFGLSLRPEEEAAASVVPGDDDPGGGV